MRHAISMLAAMTLVAAAASAAPVDEQTITLVGLSVTIWSSPTGPSTARPAIIFSHGYRGCSTQSRFLMEAFAAAGYVVFAPNHRDASCGGGRGGGSRSEGPEARFGQPQSWTDQTYRDRADDVRRLVDALRTDERYRSRIDFSRLALAGHSLGGYTVLGLGGAWPSWKLDGVRAILALSPYSQPFDSSGRLASLSAPVMYQMGTRDIGIAPGLKKISGTYDQSPSPKYFVEFNRATHFAWTNLGRTARDDIAAYSVAFLNHYVKGDAADPLLTRQAADVTSLRYASELGNTPADAATRDHGPRAFRRRRQL